LVNGCNDSGDALTILGFVLAAISLLRLLLCYCYCGAIWIQLWLCCLYDVFDYVADGESKPSHYSIATGFMALGMMLLEWQEWFIQGI
jgi:hypothetical protein